jgi:uncharacterized protein (DUF1015 family)
VPEIRPFRALRYDSATVGDPALVIAPPYDVIGPAEHERLLAAHPANVVRLDLPRDELGDEPDDRYRRAARTLAAWRSDGTLHKDPHPSIYVYEQIYRVPGTDVIRTQRGFFARLRLEAFGEGSGVLPHERTMSAPKEDRYKLLRATGVNTSPVVGLYDDAAGAGRPVLDALTTRAADLDLPDADGVRHRLWAVPADGDAAVTLEPLLAAAKRGPVTIADGHHRYETALAFHEEDGTEASASILAVIVPTEQDGLTIFPTHRIALTTSALPPLDQEPNGAGSVAEVYTRAGSGFIHGAPDELDAELVARYAGEVRYTPDAAEARAAVDAGEAEAAFLLRPPTVEQVSAVARAGKVMPQKSTFFYPKLTSGLLFMPLD